MANLFRYFLGYEETVHQRTSSCCPDSGLLKDYKCTTEQYLYPNNSAKLVQPSIGEINKDKHLFVYTTITQVDPNNNVKLMEPSTGKILNANKDKSCVIYSAITQTNPNINAQLVEPTTGKISTVFQDKICSAKKSETQTDTNTKSILFDSSASEISTMKIDKCDLVYTAITQSALKNTRFSHKSTDLISRIKQIYTECKCNSCNCIAGIELPYDASCQAGKEGKCGCHPCDCLCSKTHLQQLEPKETHEEFNDPKDNKVLWKEKFFCNIERTANICTCKPCDCVFCNKDKSGFEREAETNANDKSLNIYDCQCNPCECIFCKALSSPECKCKPWECKTCPNLFISKNSILPECMCILNTTSLHDCAPQLRKCSKTVAKREEADQENKSTPIPIIFKEKLPSFYCRIVADMSESEDDIAVSTIGEYTTLKEKDICDCTKCECISCENKDIESPSTSLTDDVPCKNCTFPILICSCEACECKICRKKKTEYFHADDVEIACLCENEGRPKCICHTDIPTEKTIKCFIRCGQCQNNKHERCTNKLCKCEKGTDEPKELNSDGSVLPFLQNDPNIYAIPTVAISDFLKQIVTETFVDTDSHNVLTDIYNMNKITEAYSAEEKQAFKMQSVRYVDNMKLAFASDDIDAFVDFDDGDEYDVHIDESNKCLYHCEDKITDKTPCICKTYMDLVKQNGKIQFKISDLLPIVDEIDEEMITKNYFSGYRPFSNESSRSNVVCQYACTCYNTNDHSNKRKNQTVQYEYNPLNEINTEIDMLINKINKDNTNIVAKTKPIRKSSNLDINELPEIHEHIEKLTNMNKIIINNNKPINKNYLLKFLNPHKKYIKKQLKPKKKV